MIYPAINLGTLAASGGTVTRVLGRVRRGDSGYKMQRVDISVGTEIASNPSDRWTLEIGTLSDTGFVAQSVHPSVWAAGLNRLDTGRTVKYLPDQVIAVRLVPQGSPPNLANADVVLHLEEP